MAKRILVFGAGDNQLMLIRACKALGYFTIVTDPNEQAPGAATADLFVPLPPRDIGAHRELIRKEDVGGIVTCQMENPLLMMAHLAREFNFPFPAPEVIRRARDKYLMKQAFLTNDVPCARGRLCSDIDELSRIDWERWTFPLIIKPVDSYSSRGVIRVENREQLFIAFPQSARFSSNGQVLLEEFLEGPEVSVEGVTFGGKTKLAQITDKVITPYPHTVELAHYQPSALPDTIQEEIKKVVARAIRALGIDHSGSHTELKITPQGPKIIEIGSRLGGDYISSHLTFLSTGIDLNRAVAQIAMGEAPDVTPNHRRFSAIRYVNWEAGRRVRGARPVDLLLRNPKVAHAGIMVKTGDLLPEVTESANRHAFLITSADSREELEKNIETLSGELAGLLTFQ